MKKKILLILSMLIVIIFGYLMYVRSNGDIITTPPEIVIKEVFYASSTNEMVVTWSVENVQYFPINNTGVRYDIISHTTTTPNSETYEMLAFPKEINSSGNFEARIDFGENDILYYRVQAKQVGDENFFWSDEGSVKKIDLDRVERIDLSGSKHVTG